MHLEAGQHADVVLLYGELDDLHRTGDRRLSETIGA
jgi:hypothetical protein